MNFAIDAILSTWLVVITINHESEISQMTNYTIAPGTDIIDATKTVWYVTFADGPRVGTRASLTGYKNEESAKRRIRDLKRKEAEAIAAVPTATPEVAKLAEVAATTIAPTLPDAAKLAASSAYGKTKMLAGLVNGAKATVTVTHMPQHSPFGTMPAGVYPAISKSERRKRWNYA